MFHGRRLRDRAGEPVEDVVLGDEELVEFDGAARPRGRSPADDHVDPARFESGLWRRSRDGSIASVRKTPRRRRGSAGSDGCGLGRVASTPCSTAATVVTVPASPTTVLASCDGREGPVDVAEMVADGGHRDCASSSGVGGSECRNCLGEAYAADVDRDQPVGLVGADDELGRAAADVDDEVRARARR